MRLAGVFALVLFSAWQPEAAGQGFGPDTYRTSQQCTGSITGECTGQGTTQPGLNCEAGSDGSRKCTGFLASAVDNTLLDVTLVVPPGAGPHPLIASLHGWAAAKMARATSPIR